MDERSTRILEAVVESFVKTGEPVSSSYLFENYDFGIKPAMIRAELNDLTDEGYLEQPHHSAGRVPQNKAYELFARSLLSRRYEVPKALSELEQSFDSGHWDEFLYHLAEDLGIMGIVSSARGDWFQKEGLEHLLSHLSWQSREEVLSVIHDCEALEERLPEVREHIGDREDFLEVFIGRKSPFTRSDELAVFAADYERDGRKMYLLGIGPKRMDYTRAVRIFKNLKTI